MGNALNVIPRPDTPASSRFTPDQIEITPFKKTHPEALSYFGRRGGGDLSAFLTLLADLPLGVSRLGNADEIATDLAEALTVARINDRLFAGTGEAIDPTVLLTPTPGRRARVSVISLGGLAMEQRPGFVDQLQMALFAWIKRNPATGRPLGALYVMDEAQDLAPAVGRAPALDSALMLSAQARKYGLGLVFATQAPKGLHNRIAGNAVTQFFGRLNAPAHIDAAKDLARSKGGNVDRIGRLGHGQFYLTSERLSFVQTQTPMCLTYHPAGPLTPEEVVERARRAGPSDTRPS